MSYGPNATDSFQRGVYFVIKILQGGKPAEIPAELGLDVPPSLLARADEVIE
jgi:putative ABC transport system substrate-binding protein